MNETERKAFQLVIGFGAVAIMLAMFAPLGTRDFVNGLDDLQGEDDNADFQG